MLFIIILSLIGISITFVACMEDKNKSMFQEFEKNWRDCYDENFQFIDDTLQMDSEFVKCKLSNQNISIHHGSDDFRTEIYHSYSGTVSNPDITLSGDTNSKYQIFISFIQPALLTGFFIRVDYPLDSLNYSIQKLFSKDYVNCSSNFINTGVDFNIGTYCLPNGRINFSTYYSTLNNQQIRIDSFNSTLNSGVWKYYLEYSASQLEITNERWNKKTKMDMNGHKLKSNILIENLLVQDLHSVILFEIPANE